MKKKNLGKTFIGFGTRLKTLTIVFRHNNVLPFSFRKPVLYADQSRLQFDAEKSGKFIEFNSAAELLIFYYFMNLNINIRHITEK